MKTDIVGVCTAKVSAETVSQEETLVVFRVDGTGWLGKRSCETHRVELFQWAPTSTGWYVLTSTGRFERDPHNLKRYISAKREPEATWAHLPISVEEIRIPLGSVVQLTMELPGWNYGLYQLTTEDADFWPVPQTPI